MNQIKKAKKKKAWPKMPCPQCGKKVYAYSDIFFDYDRCAEVDRGFAVQLDSFHPTLCAKCRDLEQLGIREERRKELEDVGVAHRFGIPAQFADSRFSDFSCGKILQRYHDNYKETGDGELLTVTGPTGAGKTRLLYAFYKESLLDRWGSFLHGDDIGDPDVLDRLIVHYVPDLFDDMRSDDDTGRRRQWQLGNMDEVLLLDDIAADKETEFSQGRLTRLIHDRELHARPTVLTTNLSIEELEEYLDPRAFSRIAGGSILSMQKDQDCRRQKKSTTQNERRSLQ
ncbi:MAG: hypothetical protein HQ592_02535 [Planctomycetes bacterium]|nr:hypothetical protein [Planctomycetota bacterium]